MWGVGASRYCLRTLAPSAIMIIDFPHIQDNSEKRSKGHSEELQPVDVDFNLVKNLLDSYTSQGGGAGPASNILSSLGVHIPDQSQSN